jgi:hypothetical protein
MPVEVAPAPERVEPSFYREFKECSSVYVMQNKEDSDEISDDEEFNDARHIRHYQQDATEVLRIEKTKEARRGALTSKNLGFSINAKAMKDAGVKSKRDRNFKYFTEVGFVGDNNTPVPRWATDMEQLKRVKKHQLENLDPT